jgi:hypothetical protein
MGNQTCANGTKKMGIHYVDHAAVNPVQHNEPTWSNPVTRKKKRSNPVFWLWSVIV